MSHILITGGNGGLGKEVVARLNPDQHTIRIMSRGVRPAALNPRLEWAQADLKNGNGVTEAVRGADVILHLASAPFRHARRVDVDGTRHLLDLAKREQVKHFIYISIVGIEHFPGFWYYRAKLEAERLIESSGLPYTILRATQFHSLIDFLFSGTNRLPFLWIPTAWQFQTIDTGEVAAELARLADEPAQGRAPDMAGPEVLRAGDMARAWLDIRGLRKPIVNLSFPGSTYAAYRRGMNTAPDRAVGQITWAQWVARQYNRASQAALSAKA